MVRCPTSEFPIVFSGSPTARPAASITAHPASALNLSMTGVSAFAMQLPCSFSLMPHPSMTIRAARLGAMLV